MPLISKLIPLDGAFEDLDCPLPYSDDGEDLYPVVKKVTAPTAGAYRSVPAVPHLEPLMVGSAIGREVYRCKQCNERSRKYANFCSNCGSRLLWNVEVKNAEH